MNRLIGEGSPEPLGVTAVSGGLNVAVFSRHATLVELCLFDADGQETERVPLTVRTGDVLHAFIPGPGVGQRYGLRAHGPFNPAGGHCFDPDKLLVDPYATRLDRPFSMSPALLAAGDTAALVPRGVVEAAEKTSAAAGPRIPWDRTVVYELSVRGFTALHPGIPETLRGTFAGLAHPAAVAHLRDLGVTTVELMPAMAWIDERHLHPLGLGNAWGYNPVALLAPDPRLAPGGWAEVRAASDALHAAGMEVILDVVLNHTGEGDEFGPTVSLRGLDNASYYRLRPDDRARYIDDAGCGNVLATDRPPVLRLAMDALRIWAQRGGMDGFRFDLAATLGRRDDGFDPAAPLLQAIAQDPVLRELKLVAEPWDIGPGGYQPGRFPAVWGEWNDRFRDDVRRFWRGDAYMTGALATRLAGSQDVFGAKGRPSRGVNFVTAHDGFTLADLVSYAGKHNEANGENNRDGTDANYAWNHGVEGPTDDPGIRAARQRDQRALLATLLLSRGTPMLAMGAEAGRSQAGNNNAYAQDNALGWLDWSTLDHGLVTFTAALADLRREHSALRADRFLTGGPDPATGLPDVEWLRLDGTPLHDGDWGDPGRRTLAATFAASTGDGADRVLLVLHAGHEPAALTLPWNRTGHAWIGVLDSAEGRAGNAGPILRFGDEATVAPRSVLLFVETPETGGAGESRPRTGVTTTTLDRLARSVGIAPEWWEETGRHHAVSDDTKRALLAAMGIEAGSEAAARDALAARAESTDRRALPLSLAAQAGLPANMPLASAGRALILRDEAGAEHRIAVPADTPVRRWTARDGRPASARLVTLPPLAPGRYDVVPDDARDAACRLVVAPQRCHALPEGGPRGGVAAHLYALRRPGDQGIGDFSTLAALGTAAARHGAAVLGLNPLHMLFPADRRRASPYHPSDRRFLDPFSIDVADLGDADPAGAAAKLLAAAGSALSDMPTARAVDYEAVWSLKSRVLDAAWQGFSRAPPTAALAAFEAFVTEAGRPLESFCRFQAIAETQPSPWSGWPADVQAPPDRVRHHQWLQWIADRQLAAAAAASRAAGLSIGLYRDLAVGAAPDGAEIWSDPDGYARGASIGAPPDLFSSEGQVWNLPPPRPLAQEQDGGAGFARLVAANMRHAGALRIDHAMALTRLFWVPDGARGADGAYVAAPLDVLMAQLALESTRAGTAVVGEDLGTVPDGFRERLDEAGILSYRVLWFERDGERFRPPGHWPALSAACVSTHDLPTLHGWWRGADIAEKAGLGLLSPEDAGKASDHRARERMVLLDALRDDGLLPDGIDAEAGDLPAALTVAIHAYVARSPSRLVLAQVDDLVGEMDAVNLPGTDRERPNWRRRLSPDADALFEGGTARAVMAILAALREAAPASRISVRR